VKDVKGLPYIPVSRARACDADKGVILHILHSAENRTRTNGSEFSPHYTQVRPPARDQEDDHGH